MQSLIDAIGAVIVGGVIVISMITALSNVQIYSYNTNSHFALNKISESVTTVIQERYLSPLGLYTPGSVEPSNTIVAAGDNTFQFYAEIDGSTQLVVVEQGTQDGTTGWWPLYVEVGGSKELGDFFTDQEFIFTYYDQDGNKLAFISNFIPSANLPNIRSIKVELAFIYAGYNNQTGAAVDIHNKIIFWTFFKNQYL